MRPPRDVAINIYQGDISEDRGANLLMLAGIDAGYDRNNAEGKGLDINHGQHTFHKYLKCDEPAHTHTYSYN